MTFARVLGQKRAAAVLSGLLRADRIPSALLFCGLEGTGKTLMALEFAKSLVCRARRGDAAACQSCSDCAAVEKRNHPDVALVNAAYQACLREEEPAKQRTLRVDTIRHLRKDMEMRSLLGGWKVAVIEDAHTLEVEAANALLKTLEEPQPGVLWILLTAQRELLPRTVPSRCFAVAFSPLTPAVIQKILMDRGTPAERAADLASFCEGSASRALELEETDYPGSLTESLLAPLQAADSLPKELYLARVSAERALFALGQDLRLKHLRGLLPFASVEGPLRELLALRRALRSNADPKAVLTLACLEAESCRPV
jgi:DNA polymerase-3 subunit delta'